MKDLLIHSKDSFVPPVTYTEDYRTALSQAYLGILLTELGSSSIDPELGTSFKIGSMVLEMQQVNNQIYEIMREPYGVTAIKLQSYERIDDFAKMSVLIEYDGQSTTVSLEGV